MLDVTKNRLIKFCSNKYGSIQIEEQCLKNSIKKCLLDIVSESKLINIDLDIKKNSLKKVEVSFKKNLKISFDEQKSLYDQITFLLSMRYGINNSLIIFNYEN